jgi:hypothetical protein
MFVQFRTRLSSKSPDNFGHRRNCEEAGSWNCSNHSREFN